MMPNEEEFMLNIAKTAGLFLFMLLVGALLREETAIIMLLCLIYIKMRK